MSTVTLALVVLLVVYLGIAAYLQCLNRRLHQQMKRPGIDGRLENAANKKKGVRK